MKPEHMRNVLIIGLLMCSSFLFIFPIEPQMSTAVLFDDEVKERVVDESVGNSSRNGLVLRVLHDDGGKLTSNLSRVQQLMMLEKEALDGSNLDTSWDATHVRLERIVTPMQYWSNAFAVHNRSLANATQWKDVMEPTIDDGWCGNSSSEEELAAFEVTLMLLPKHSNFNLACPTFAGSSAEQPPDANELLWMVWLDDDVEGDSSDWGELYNWADKISDSTEFEFEAVGVNMMFAKAKSNAINDLYMIIPISIVILTLILSIGLRDIRCAGATIGGVGLVLGAELGLLAAIDYPFSVIDGIGIPIILGVAVDGAFWYSLSSRKRDEVRSMLFVAMMTTVAAVSLAMLSPINAQRSLSFIIAIGVIASWAMTRFVLEGLFLKRREMKYQEDEEKSTSLKPALTWFWPVGLTALIAIALISPSGVSPLYVEQFLSEDDPVLDLMEVMKAKYVLASSTDVWIVLDVEGDSEDDLISVQDFQKQLMTHPSIISIDSGIYRSPIAIGLSADGEGTTIDEFASTGSGSMLMEDPRLQRGGVTSGVAIVVFIDGSNTNAAITFTEDVEKLIVTNNLSGGVGGDVASGAEATKTIEESRIGQILIAGIAVFFVALYILSSTKQAMRIAIGTVAVGIALDGLAWYIGGRGVASSLAVLLGMGFAADYLSHASGEHILTGRDTMTRWWAAITSASAFALLGIVEFPPAQSTGRLLTLAILISVMLATFLSFKQSQITVDADL